jgi:UDP-N-acetylglucosamine 3-dehydrogenase
VSGRGVSCWRHDYRKSGRKEGADLTATYRAAIIGTARVGSWYDDLLASQNQLEEIPSSHAGCYAAHPKTTLVAGSDLDPERLQKFGQKWSVSPEHLYADYREMLAQEKPDIVSVTTAWGHDHAGVAPVVAESGVAAIFCEKPIGTSMAEAQRIVDAVRWRNVTFACAYYRRYNSRYHALRELLDGGAIGRILSVTAIGVANLMHAGTHYADIMAYLCGDPDLAFAWGRIEPIPPDAKSPTAKVDPLGSGYIEMRNGVRLFLEGVSSGAITFLVSGTGGRLIIANDARDAELWRPPAGGAGRWLERQDVPLPPQDKSRTLVALEDLIESMETGRKPRCDERLSARAMELCLALHASHRSGGCRVDFPLQDRDLSVDTW